MKKRRRTKNSEYLGYLLAKARTNANYSQQEVADKLGVSRNTLANWEEGISSPSFDDIMDIFYAIGETPYPYLNEYLHPNSNVGNKSSYDERRKELHNIIDSMPNKMIDGLLFLCKGLYGSVYAYIQLCVANAQTTLYDRQIVGKIIRNNYDMNKMRDTLLYTDEITPDLDAFDNALESGSKAVINGHQKYAINKKGGDD